MFRTRFTGLWRHSDFLKLWSGQTISVFGTLIGRFALSLTAILVLEASAIEVSFLRVAELAPVLVVGLFAGVWVDRLRRRDVMIVADLGRALALFSIPIAAVLGVLRIEQLYVVALIVSVLGLFFDVAYRSYLPALVRRDQLVEGNSKLEATNSIAEVSGFSLAGLLVQLLTAPVAILIDAVSFLVSALSLALIRTPEGSSGPGSREGAVGEDASSLTANSPLPGPDQAASRAPSVRREIAEGLRLVRGDRVLRAFVGAEGTQYFFGYGFIGTVIMLFIARELALDPVVMGVVFSLGGVSSLLGAVFAERVTRRWGIGPTMLYAYLISTVATLFVPLAGGPMFVILVFLSLQQLLGDGMATIYNINQTSLLQALTPDHLLGRVNSLMRLVGWGGMLLGSLVAGVLAETIGLRATLFAAVAGSSLALLWLYFSPVRHLREAPAMPLAAGDAGAVGVGAS